MVSHHLLFCTDDHVQAMADVANLGETSRRLYNHIEAEIQIAEKI